MSTILAVDLGGTKILAALVDGAAIIERAETGTDRDGGPEFWLAQIADLVTRWTGRFSAIGVAVTGRVKDGQWWATNPQTLAIPDAFPLAREAERALGMPAFVANDAQAAAWGEFLHGAGASRDMAFLTISTGIGGGIVLDGRLLAGRGGLAGSVGQIEWAGGQWFEDAAAGRWMASQAGRAGHDTDARGVFAAAANGQAWAEEIVQASASRVAALCATLQHTIDPEIIVIGGGIGLAPGYLARIDAALQDLPPARRPALAPAALGADAGIIGIANLANNRETRP